MELTPEQQARVDRAASIINAVTHQIMRELGVVVLPALELRKITLPDHRTRIETEARFDYAILANWQPLQPEAKDYPKDDTDETEIPAYAYGDADTLNRSNGAA